MHRTLLPRGQGSTRRVGTPRHRRPPRMRRCSGTKTSCMAQSLRGRPRQDASSGNHEGEWGRTWAPQEPHTQANGKHQRPRNRHKSKPLRSLGSAQRTRHEPMPFKRSGADASRHPRKPNAPRGDHTATSPGDRQCEATPAGRQRKNQLHPLRGRNQRRQRRGLWTPEKTTQHPAQVL